MRNNYLMQILFLALTLTSAASSFAYGATHVNLVDPTKPYQWTDVVPADVSSTTGKDADLVVPQALNLDSVLYAPDRRLAVINGQTVREGGIVDKAKVLKILRQAVVVKKDGVTKTLTLQKFGEDQDFKLIRR